MRMHQKRPKPQPAKNKEITKYLENNFSLLLYVFFHLTTMNAKNLLSFDLLFTSLQLILIKSLSMMVFALSFMLS